MPTISNYKVTMGLLEKHGLNAKKRLGQNFIIDPSIVKKIAENSGATRLTTAIEIGPGLGALTQQLSLVANEVIAIEIDDDMVEVLKDSLDVENVKIIHQDFLEVDLSQFSHLEDVVVCANVPYYITTPILFKLIESDLKLSQITLMVQKEVAERLSAKVKTKEYNALSVMMDYLFEHKLLFKVPAACFYPKPRVDSSVVSLKYKHSKQVHDQKKFFDFVKTCFVQRRKTLHNNLKAILDSTQIEKLFLINNLKPSVRAQELTTQQFIEMYRSIYET